MTGSMRVLRVFRLARLVRAARLTVQFRTLWLLLSGLKASMMTILWTFVLISTITYIFAVFGMETIPPRNLDTSTEFDQVAVDNFGSLAAAMLTLLQVLTLDSIGIIYRPLIMNGTGNMPFFCALYFVMFILIVSVALMNLVTAVMVEGSLHQANEDKEAMRAFEDQRKKALLPRLREMFEFLDEDGSGEVSWEEIENAPDELKDELRHLAKSDDLAEIFQLLDDDDSGSVQIDEFLDGILKASSGDVMQKLQIGRLLKQVAAVKTEVVRESQRLIAAQGDSARQSDRTALKLFAVELRRRDKVRGSWKSE